MTEEGLAPDRTLPPLSPQQRVDWLRLIRSENVGPSTFRVLVNRYGGAAAALEALPDLARRGGGRAIRVATRVEAERELDAIEGAGARLVALGEPDYPRLLGFIDAPPPLLTVLGDGGVLRRETVAIVGSRNASAAGRTLTRQIAEALGVAGFVIASGLARGIDTAAHQASLAKGTVAVLAGGLDRLYPPENADLFAAISRTGAAITEMPMGWQAQARDFPRRNRIVAGIGIAVVVVEAAERSGSLITARLAGDFGREVAAVPGSPLDPRCAGTNKLIRDGALIVTTVDDLVDHIRSLSDATLPRAEPIMFRAADVVLGHDDPPDDERGRVLSALGVTPTDMDVLRRETGLSAGSLAMILLELELAGRLERHAGNRVSLLP